MTSVCIINPGDISRPRGGENRAIAFAKGLRDHGFDVHLVIPEPTRELPKELCGIKIHTVKVSSRGGNLKNQFLRALFLSRKAKKVAERYNAILQFEHSPFAGFATLMGHSGFVLDMHDLAMADPTYSKILYYKKIFGWFEKRGIYAALKVIIVSNPMKEFIIKEWGVPEEKIEVIPNGYFESKFKKLELDNTREVEGMISFLGTLHLKLDIDKIVYLAKLLKNSKIYIIGDGPARVKLERKIKKNKLKNIIITGWLPDERAFSLVAKSQVCILPEQPSKHVEVSCPVKLFDYGALGKAIVADNVSEMCRLFGEKNAALLSDPNNPDEFVENVLKLLNNEKIRRRISNNAKKIVKDYTWEKLAKKLVRVYEKLYGDIW